MKILRTGSAVAWTIAALVLSGGAHAGDEEEIRAVFDQYREAVQGKSGETVASLMSKDGIAYYVKLRDLALDGTREVLRQQLMIEQNQVLLLRVRMTREELEKLSGKELVAHLTSSGWVSMPGSSQAGLGPVQITDSEARGQAMIGERAGAPDYFRFTREEEGWRLDPTHSFKRGEQSLKSMQGGRDSDVFLMSLIKAVSGEPVGESIWEPLRKRDG